MLKNILELKGAQKMSKNEQKEISGGITQACITATANGCITSISPANCNLNAGLYNKACRCCNL